MIELKKNGLRISSPELDRRAGFTINFQRTLRIPDDDNTYPLPPGLGSFPLRHVDDFAERVPEHWRRHGGLLLPMYQSEALWVAFGEDAGFAKWGDIFLSGYGESAGWPYAVKIAAGKINAVTGLPWQDGLVGTPQDYLVVPGQPWLDGFCIEKGSIRQFVAASLGSGATVEEQLTGEAQTGGLQIVAYPMKAERFQKILRERRAREARVHSWSLGSSVHESVHEPLGVYSVSSSYEQGLAAGGRMKQDIKVDPHGVDAWDQRYPSRCFVHLANSLAWRGITDQAPPTAPRTAADYERAGLPWFDYYSDGPAVEGASCLAGVKSVAELDAENGSALLPENQSVVPGKVIELGPGSNLKPGQVREGRF
jgi:hypothetical protein